MNLPPLQLANDLDSDDKFIDRLEQILDQDSEKDIGRQLVNDLISEDYQSVTQDIINCNNKDSDGCNCGGSDYKRTLEDNRFLQKKLTKSRKAKGKNLLKRGQAAQ